jgi:hypothetical protein
MRRIYNLEVGGEKDRLSIRQNIRGGSMKVLAVNSGPRSGEESYTVMMLNPLVEGMREAGADVEELHRLSHLLDQNTRPLRPKG